MEYKERLATLMENISVSTEFDDEGNFSHNSISYLERLNTLLDFIESEKRDDLRKAIRNNRIVTFMYNGDENNAKGVRVVEPYVLGVTKAGNKAIRAWQIQGSSDSSDELPGWRMFLTKNITQLKLSEETFAGKRSGLNTSGDKGMVRIELHHSKTKKSKKNKEN